MPLSERNPRHSAVGAECSAMPLREPAGMRTATWMIKTSDAERQAGHSCFSAAFRMPSPSVGSMRSSPKKSSALMLS